jgi:4-aminobutyrate aminotransferase-like enzyme
MPAQAITAAGTPPERQTVLRCSNLGHRQPRVVAAIRLQALKARHAVIGDVRDGHGLFAVVELVRERASRVPLAPWPAMHGALRMLGELATQLAAERTS